MKDAIFVDTSGFYALLCKQDEKHQRAKEVVQAAKNKQFFFSTDYVIDETATLLHARGLTGLIPSFFDVVFASRACSIVWMDQERFLKTRMFFLKHLDHAWSFTDCLSFIVMKELKLIFALTKDRHFQEAGFHPLL